MKGGVKAGLIAVAVIFVAILLTVWACSGDDEVPQQDDAETPVVVTFPLNEAQQSAVDFARAVQMQAISCSGDVERAQAEMEKVGGGTLDEVEVFRVLGQAEKSCASAADEIRQIDVGILANATARKVATEALKVCGETAESRQQAMALGRDFLEGEDSIKVAADYRDKLTAASGADQTCKLQLLAAIEPFKVPDSEVAFLR